MSWSYAVPQKVVTGIVSYFTVDVTKISVRKTVVSVGSLVSFFLLWYLGSTVFPDALPAPGVVLAYTVESITLPGPRGRTGVDHLFTSLYRVAIIGAISLTATIVVGVLMGVNETFEDVVSMWLPFWMTTPDVIAILFFMILLGFKGSSVIIVVAIFTAPFGIVNVWEGIQDLNQELVQMGRTFDVETRSMWRHVYLPHLLPYVFASSRYLLGQIWKIVLVGEAIGLSTGIGSVIRFWFNQGEITPIIAYLMLFMVIVLCLEYGVLKPLERHFFKWRPD
jgi:NitT/TauT family transport system permease protein